MIANEFAKKLRNRIHEAWRGTNNIDLLMSDKVNPYLLMEEAPASFQIGQYTIFVGNFTIENNFKFWDGYGRILAKIGIKHVNFDMLADGADIYKALHLHRRLYKDLIKLIHRTICKQQAYYLDQMGNREALEWTNIPLRYFVRNMSIEKLIQMCFMIYLYNFDAEKKNLSVLAFKLPAGNKQTMETYMSFYYENMVGLTGKFQLAHLERPWDLSDAPAIQEIKVDGANERQTPAKTN